jgi:hypothetical protein
MALLKLGSRGDAVRLLQLQLRALGYDVGDIDGVFGPKTNEQVLAFQRDTDSIDVDGLVGTETMEALKQALVMKDNDPVIDAVPAGLAQAGGAPVAVGQAGVTPCDQATWHEFQQLVDLLSHTPVKYGPGRGLFVNGEWKVSKGPGRLNSTQWLSKEKAAYASFHCSSFTNFFLGWLLRYDEDWTHAGNIPSLFELCEMPNVPRTKDGIGTYRGYGPFCQQILSDGSTHARNPKAKGLDIKELHDRRATLPTFLVCGQSSRRADGTWREWHHTLVFAIDHSRPGSPMCRIAADGTKDKETKRWSAQAMKCIDIDDAWVNEFVNTRYFRPYGVQALPDGSYDHLGTGVRPRVTVEV